MSEPVHILASCRSLDLLPATLMVFKTVRVGFPTAPLKVTINPMLPGVRGLVGEVADRVGAETSVSAGIRHDAWITQLLESYRTPFWVLDTDVAFFGQVEGSQFFAPFAGRFVPAFDDPWTSTTHVERLHTALMRFDPVQITEETLAWACQFPESWMAPRVNFVAQHYVPRRGKQTEFYDTTAGLWHTIGGAPFTDGQNALFEHVNCATYADLIGPSFGPDYKNFTLGLAQHPELSRGLQAEQNKFYLAHAPKE